MNLRALLWQVLAFGVLPLWLLAGAADWLCHRRSDIEFTSGARESKFHLLLFAEIGVPLLLGLWLEVNAGLLAFMAACVLAHHLTTWRDTAYSQPLRHIAPFEQQVHGFMELLPLFALVMVALLHWDALVEPRWRPQWRTPALPLPWRIGVPIALAIGLALILEEHQRGRRAAAARV